VHQTPEANDHLPHRYTLCEACRELWLAARFGAICPLCVGAPRSPSSAVLGPRRYPVRLGSLPRKAASISSRRRPSTASASCASRAWRRQWLPASFTVHTSLIALTQAMVSSGGRVEGPSIASPRHHSSSAPVRATTSRHALRSDLSVNVAEIAKRTLDSGNWPIGAFVA